MKMQQNRKKNKLYNNSSLSYRQTTMRKIKEGCTSKRHKFRQFTIRTIVRNSTSNLEFLKIFNDCMKSIVT